MTKKCPKCSKSKRLSSFSKNKGKRFGLSAYCKSCDSAYRNKYNKVHREERTLYRHKRDVKVLYGLSYERYEQMYREQKGFCALCETPSVDGKRLSVDHNHKTGAIRGLLCTKCNTGLGAFNDSPKLLYKAVEYLGNERIRNT